MNKQYMAVLNPTTANTDLLKTAVLGERLNIFPSLLGILISPTQRVDLEYEIILSHLVLWEFHLTTLSPQPTHPPSLLISFQNHNIEMFLYILT